MPLVAEIFRLGDFLTLVEVERGSVAGNGLLDGFLGGSCNHFSLLFQDVIQKLHSEVPNVRGVYDIFVTLKRLINPLESILNQILEKGSA